MSATQGVSLLDPSVGLADDQDVTIKGLRAVVGEDTNDKSKQWPSLTLTFTMENGKEGHEFYSAGKLEKLRPSPDGLRLVPNTDGAKLSDQTNAWKFISSILNAIRGAQDTKAAEAFMARLVAEPDRLDHFDGMKVHVNRVQKQKREGDDSDKNRTIMLVSKVVAFPGGQGGGAAAKSAGKGQTTGAAAAKAKQAASTPAAPVTPAAPATTAPAAGGDVTDEQVAAYLLSALQAKGSILRTKVATEAYGVAKAANDPNWKAVMGRANNEDFLKAFAEEPKEVDGNILVVEYDGEKLTLVS